MYKSDYVHPNRTTAACVNHALHKIADTNELLFLYFKNVNKFINLFVFLCLAIAVHMLFKEISFYFFFYCCVTSKI